jgi:phospholipid/cholesterol/gamma-HCH transport system permease protein
MNTADRIANRILGPVRDIGDIVIFAAKMFRTVPSIPRSRKLILESMLEIGVNSLPIVFIIALFVGATTAWQANYQLEGYVSNRFLGSAVSKSIILELGPALTGLVVAGRIGASIAASLGAMRVTEQIDALSTMAIDPIRYLVLPRVVAAIIMLPMLNVYSVVFGIGGGMFVSVQFLDVSSGIFIFGLKRFFYITDVIVSLSKATIFGFGLSLLGCYYGFNASGGAEGVGRAAIKAYVTAAVFILLTDFMVAAIAF